MYWACVRVLEKKFPNDFFTAQMNEIQTSFLGFNFVLHGSQSSHVRCFNVLEYVLGTMGKTQTSSSGFGTVVQAQISKPSWSPLCRRLTWLALAYSTAA